ncbi:MAG TPA: glycoside hydrolase family 3 C-terminal domain-containing protein [Phenylobacterium sp.]|nr:glycoside hydrolase family 3 C-terminal domain-containing protein [Phenylobacterium sp.]
MTETYRDASAPLDARAADLLSRLSLEEKVALMGGASSFSLNAIERLGVPSLSMTDGPTGVRSIKGEEATVFPVGVAVAATWNPETARAVAGAIAREAQALGDQVVLAPTINIMRIPTWGRNFETYSEDPYLAGRMGTAYVQGLQAEGVGASLKHYAANNQEQERFRVDARIDERTLREIYLAAFEMVVREADPWTVMASYNKLNGTYASEHRRLLTGILKEEWGYEGMVVSDWSAVRSTAPAANAGLDLEMPGPPRRFGDKLLAAAQAGEVAEAQIDDNARRVLRLILRSGLLDGPRPAGELRTPRHRRIALEAAAEGMVLLKNEGETLPLPRTVRRLAVIGPNAVRCLLQGGGSSQVVTGKSASPAEALRAHLGEAVEVIEAQGVDNDIVPPIPDPWLFSPDEARSETGLRVEYFASTDLSGEPHTIETERGFVRRASPNIASATRPAYGSFRWSGVFWPELSGDYEFSVRSTGEATLRLNGETLISPDAEASVDVFDVVGMPAPRRLATARLEAGRPYRLAIECAPRLRGYEYLGLGVRKPVEPMEKAIEAARGADAVVLVTGSGLTTEAEGYDRTDIDLPGRQDELVEAVLAVNPNTVVVVNAGSPMAMPWIAKAPAVLQMWLPGETGAEALARVLFGQMEPAGRLPVSFPARFGDHPAHAPQSDPLEAPYVEGLAVGYRHYDRAAPPLFPFGHGLAYTSFELSDLQAPTQARIGEPVTVRVKVRNTGGRPGSEVVQLYVAPKAPRLPRPLKELKGFGKLQLPPGEVGELVLQLDARAFACFDPEAGAWTTDPGDYDLLVGRSASDIRLRTTVRLSDRDAPS